MNIRRRTVFGPKLVKIVAAVLIGLSIGTAIPPSTIYLSGVGSMPSVVVGGIGLVSGVVAYQWGPNILGSSDCGCSGDCGCS